jgi:hypothetical protein
MPAPVDLTPFGPLGSFPFRGTVKCAQFVEGSPVLLLLGERHSLKPFIRGNILNAIDLWDRGLVSCVGVEGPWPEEPSWCGTKLLPKILEELKEEPGATTEKLVDGLLSRFPPKDSFFTKVLRVVRPELPVTLAEDEALYTKTRPVEAEYTLNRVERIYDALIQSDFFLPLGDIYWETDAAAKRTVRDAQARQKAEFQWEQEFAEEEINYARDEAFIANTFKFLESTDRTKAAILNAGSAHQHHIARRLGREKRTSFIHIEQP